MAKANKPKSKKVTTLPPCNSVWLLHAREFGTADGCLWKPLHVVLRRLFGVTADSTVVKEWALDERLAVKQYGREAIDECLETWKRAGVVGPLTFAQNGRRIVVYCFNRKAAEGWLEPMMIALEELIHGVAKEMTKKATDAKIRKSIAEYAKINQAVEARLKKRGSRKQPALTVIRQRVADELGFSYSKVLYAHRGGRKK